MRRAASHSDPFALALLGGALIAAFGLGRWSSATPVTAPAEAVPAVSTAAAPATHEPLHIGAYRAHVTRVIDGDTVEARIPVWLGQEIITKIRLRGIDAPEMAGACGAERTQAEAARERLAALIGDRPVMLSEIGPDKYSGRVVARLHTGQPDAPVDAGAILISEGHARRYNGKRRDGWCQLAGG